MTVNPAYLGVDYSNQPLVPAWYTLGLTSQNPDYQVAPQSGLFANGLPADQLYVQVKANYFDGNGNPLAGYLTFEQSDSVTVSENGTFWRLPQRFTGDVPSGDWWGYNNLGSGRIYIYYGLLNLYLMATDNPNSLTDSGNPLVYHVREYFQYGRMYDITVPGASASPVDINSLIVPGTVLQNQDWNTGEYNPNDQSSTAEPAVPATQTQSVASTQYVSVDVAASVSGVVTDPTSDLIYMAFVSANVTPQDSDFVTATWAGGASPYIAHVLVGPGGIALARGLYTIWFKIIDTPEVPVVSVGRLYIT